MRTSFLAALCAVAWATPLGAQTAVAQTWTLVWDQALAGGALESYAHLVAVDDAAPTPLDRDCTEAGEGAVTCEAELPAMTPGEHRLRIITRRTVGDETFEADAAPANDTIAVMLVVVSGPTNIRVTVQP